MPMGNLKDYVDMAKKKAEEYVKGMTGLAPQAGRMKVKRMKEMEKTLKESEKY